ncbi:MAG TPA: hypothetical protein VK796_03690, partial [Cytophaga sp.]|nr:hypothetical protein [Cytophaga sp.]
YLSSSENISKSVAYELKQSLINLTVLYSAGDAESENKKNNLLQELFSIDNQMMDHMIQLQKENDILKRSFFNRVVKKIRSLIKR